jgi:hypothetical protein
MEPYTSITFGLLRTPGNEMIPRTLSAALRRRGAEFLYYLAHRDDVPSILQRGILSYNMVMRAGFQHQSIANKSVQRRRDVKEVFGLPIHDYVPLYLARRNPMLLKVWQDFPRDFAYVRINLEAADKGSTTFSDGNAASDATSFFRKLSKVDEIPWEVLWSEWWNEFPDGKRQRCAEILIPKNVEPRFIFDVKCYKPVAVDPRYSRLVKVDRKFLRWQSSSPSRQPWDLSW